MSGFSSVNVSKLPWVWLEPHRNRWALSGGQTEKGVFVDIIFQFRGGVEIVGGEIVLVEMVLRWHDSRPSLVSHPYRSP